MWGDEGWIAGNKAHSTFNKPHSFVKLLSFTLMSYLLDEKLHESSWQSPSAKMLKEMPVLVAGFA